MSSLIGVYCDSSNSQLIAKAHELEQALSCPLLTAAPSHLPPGNFVLAVQPEGLALCFTGEKAPKPITVNFAVGASAHRRQYGGGKSQLLAKAVGLRSSFRPEVLDLTAGLGEDGFVLASLGCQLSLIERVPVIYHLLRDGLERALNDEELIEIVQRMQLQQQSSHEYLHNLTQPVDVIYLDPMFPERDKSAKSKKTMTAFQALVGKDEDAGQLLPTALEKARYRVVVKRPRKAPSVDQQFPSLQLPPPALVMAGKSTRFDIYPQKKMP